MLAYVFILIVVILIKKLYFTRSSVATLLRCGGIFTNHYCKLSSECASERIL